MPTDSKPSVFTTLPGILGGIAALLTAGTGLYIALRDHGPKLGPTEPHPITTPEPADSVLVRGYVRLGKLAVQDSSRLIFTSGGFDPVDSAGFLTVSDASFGTVDTAGSRVPNVFRFQLTLRNTTNSDIQLDLTSRFFTLRDNNGRSAALRYFCCSSRGDLLRAGEARQIVLFFYSTEWYGKGIGASTLILSVDGLLPLEHGEWHYWTLATAA